MDKKSNYKKFFLMILTSTIVMFLLMYLNSYQIFAHAWFSETRMYMSFIMAAGMMIVMLSFMLDMYRNKTFNAFIYLGSAALLFVSVLLVRSQLTVTGIDYMEGMIPHHSIAIMTSERADIKDPRVRELADNIIRAQRKEIKEMEWLINDIKKNGIAKNQEDANARAVPDFEGKISKSE